MSEAQVIRQCAPTLAGLKTGNLFAVPCGERAEILAAARRLNQVLGPKGLRILPVQFRRGKALIYVFRPSRLRRDLQNEIASRVLAARGYPCREPELCVVRLVERLRESEEFPHEIGLFLGYPPEDVEGFIENKAGAYKCVGCWKVYGDEVRARRVFCQYKKCTRVYCEQWSKGVPISRLAVAA